MFVGKRFEDGWFWTYRILDRVYITILRCVLPGFAVRHERRTETPSSGWDLQGGRRSRLCLPKLQNKNYIHT